MLSEYFDAFHARVNIHRKWDDELEDLLKNGNGLKYEENLAEAALSLRAIREAVQSTSYTAPVSEFIREIESMEDQHLCEKIILSCG